MMKTKLIEQLARKALDAEVDERVWILYSSHLNQFADLVVQECLGVLDNVIGTTPVDDEWDKTWRSGVESSLEILQEHFEVKYVKK